jgi:hypothetical protein
MENVTVQVKYGAIQMHSVCSNAALSKREALLLICKLKTAIDELDGPGEPKCPAFIADRMERLKDQPPPTAEKVEKQMAASILIRQGADNG